MDSDWTAEVVKRMHIIGVTGLELAKAAGISNQYLSKVLHGKQGKREKTRQRIESALERLEQRQTRP